MSLYAAVILLGQVGNSGAAAAPPVNTVETPAVRYGDQSESPAAPARPAAEPPARPRFGATVVDSAPPASLPAARAAQPAARPEQPAVRAIQPPPVRAEPPAAVAEPQAAAAPPTANSHSLQVASTMMEEILTLDAQSQQGLRRVRLIEALSRIGDPAIQSTVIRAYWDLAQSIAAARYAADKVRMLTEVTPPAAETDQAMLAESVASAEAEEAAAQDFVLATQFALLRVTGLPFEDALPWPADAPLVAPYRTQFTTIFANQPAPLALRQIHQSLPGKLSLIEKRVSAMGAAESATDALLESYKGGRTPLVQLLSALERLDQSRRAFLNSVVDYNQQIAEYSLAVVGSGVGPETLVATLIKTTPANANGKLVEIPREVRQAAASAPTRDGVQTR